MPTGKKRFSLNSQKYSIIQGLVRKVRSASKLTQMGLAGKLNKPQSYISKIETGERNIDLVELDMLCDACGTTLARFVKDYKKKVDQLPE